MNNSKENLKDIVLELFEDEVDCAIVNDKKFQGAMDYIANDNSPFDDDSNINDDDISDMDIDLSLDYTTNPGVQMEDIEADDIISAARDIAYNPFEDDEYIDAAIGDEDEYIEEE